MSPAEDRSKQDELDEYPEIRRQLIALIRNGRRKAAFTHERPADVRFREVLRPESGFPLTERGMWEEIERLLDSGVRLTCLPLRQPPGEKAWVFRARLAPGFPVIYVKLQMLGGTVLVRSFHPSERGHE